MRVLYTILLIVLAGCSKTSSISIVTMPTPKGTGPWQVVTYDEKRVEREVVGMIDNKVVSEAKAVYVDSNGRFVFKDGSAILTYRGEQMYWNSQGLILSDSGRLVEKEEVFSLDSKPLNSNVAMLYLDSLRNGRANARRANENN